VETGRDHSGTDEQALLEVGGEHAERERQQHGDHRNDERLAGNQAPYLTRGAANCTEERELAVTDGLPRTSRQAIRDGLVAAGVRWCWMEFADLDAVDAFVYVIRLKHQLLARPD
jgi:hypothetical protein